MIDLIAIASAGYFTKPAGDGTNYVIIEPPKVTAEDLKPTVKVKS